MCVHPVRQPPTRHGSILVIVLISLLVATMLGLGLIKTVLIHHRQSRVVSGQQQAFWLAEAGVQRAVRKLAETPQYQGEVWQVPADVLGSSRTAAVTVEVVKSDEKPNQRVIRVHVELDDGLAQPTGYQQEYRVTPSPASVATEEEDPGGA
jgi:Tfp pilus assembly protein PilX